MKSTIRNSFLSVEYRLWQVLVQANWVITETGVPLTAVAGASGTYTSLDIPFPWCFLDSNGLNPTRDRVKIYENAALVDPADYTLDFRNRTVTFKVPPTGTVTADLDYFACSVIENFEEEQDQVNSVPMKIARMPLIAYGLSGMTGIPFAIGTTAIDRNYTLIINASCINDGQKKDLADDLVTRLMAIPLLDFSAGEFLTSTGEANLGFDATEQQVSHFRVSAIRCSFPDPHRGGSDSQKHRLVFSATLKNVV